MIQRVHRHPEPERESDSPILHAGNQLTKTIPQAIGLDEVADSEAFNLEVLAVLTDVPADQEGGI